MPTISRELLSELADYMDANLSVGNLTRWLYFNELQIPDGWNEDITTRLGSAHRQSLQLIYDFSSLTQPCGRCGCHSRRLDNVIDNPPGAPETTHLWCRSCVEAYATNHRGRYVTHVPQNTSVQGYHSGSRAFLHRDVDFTNPNLLGLEIETYVAGSVADNVHKAINGRPILAERDGSLDSTHGVEFIFRPITLDNLTEDSYVGQWAKAMREAGSQGFRAGDRYGMHINVNIGPWSKLHVGKFCHCLNSRAFRELHQKIAGRNENNYFRFNDGRVKDFRHETDKYLAAANRGSRVEVRIFRSALNWDRIRRNCEYVDSFIAFSRDNSMRSLTVENYYRFLSLAHNHKRYQLLRTFLGLHTPKNVEVLVDC